MITNVEYLQATHLYEVDAELLVAEQRCQVLESFKGEARVPRLAHVQVAQDQAQGVLLEHVRQELNTPENIVNSKSLHIL